MITFQPITFDHRISEEIPSNKSRTKDIRRSLRFNESKN